MARTAHKCLGRQDQSVQWSTPPLQNEACDLARGPEAKSHEDDEGYDEDQEDHEGDEGYDEGQEGDCQEAHKGDEGYEEGQAHEGDEGYEEGERSAPSRLEDW